MYKRILDTLTGNRKRYKGSAAKCIYKQKNDANTEISGEKKSVKYFMHHIRSEIEVFIMLLNLLNLCE